MKTQTAEKNTLRSVTMTTTTTATLTKLLNQALANALNLKLQAKQAHWNIKGPNFIALHELFDRVATEVDGHADTLAERIVQLGGIAEGTLQNVNTSSNLDTYPADSQDEQTHIKALGEGIAKFAEGTGQAITQAADAGDDVTADICTEVTRGMDMLHWFVTAHTAK